DHNIVRFRGTFTSKGLAKRAFHFDSWRLNTQGNWWMPAYVYTEEWKSQELHKLWFRAQTRVWDYKMRDGEDHRETTKDVDAPEDFPNQHPHKIEDIENAIVAQSQASGLMAPDGEVNQILDTVVNNILVTNDLDIAGVRCRVLLTAPLESFVVGRTIVLSRGLLDVLPDEATLAAVLAHELAHVILSHEVISRYLTSFALPFPDSLIPKALDFHFNRTQEVADDKKGVELFSKSPYKDQFVNAGRFLKALEDNSERFPVLLHGSFSHDFGSSHLAGMQARHGPNKPPK